MHGITKTDDGRTWYAMPHTGNFERDVIDMMDTIKNEFYVERIRAEALMRIEKKQAHEQRLEQDRLEEAAKEESAENDA